MQVHSSEPGEEKRVLVVEDALEYIEQVRKQLENCPNAYNCFLDTMKDFKSQRISTVEVIRRVCTLFRAHRNLAVGFNKFLPPNYKIESRHDPETGLMIGFSTPQGHFFTLPCSNHVTDVTHNPIAVNDPVVRHYLD